MPAEPPPKDEKPLTPADYQAAGFDPPHWDDDPFPFTPEKNARAAEIERKVRAHKANRDAS